MSYKRTRTANPGNNTEAILLHMSHKDGSGWFTRINLSPVKESDQETGVFLYSSKEAEHANTIINASSSPVAIEITTLRPRDSYLRHYTSSELKAELHEARKKDTTSRKTQRLITVKETLDTILTNVNGRRIESIETDCMFRKDVWRSFSHIDAIPSVALNLTSHYSRDGIEETLKIIRHARNIGTLKMTIDDDAVLETRVTHGLFNEFVHTEIEGVQMHADLFKREHFDAISSLHVTIDDKANNILRYTPRVMDFVSHLLFSAANPSVLKRLYLHIGWTEDDAFTDMISHIPTALPRIEALHVEQCHFPRHYGILVWNTLLRVENLREATIHSSAIDKPNGPASTMVFFRRLGEIRNLSHVHISPTHLPIFGIEDNIRKFTWSHPNVKEFVYGGYSYENLLSQNHGMALAIYAILKGTVNEQANLLDEADTRPPLPKEIMKRILSFF